MYCTSVKAEILQLNFKDFHPKRVIKAIMVPCFIFHLLCTITESDLYISAYQLKYFVLWYIYEYIYESNKRPMKGIKHDKTKRLIKASIMVFHCYCQYNIAWSILTEIIKMMQIIKFEMYTSFSSSRNVLVRDQEQTTWRHFRKGKLFNLISFNLIYLCNQLEELKKKKLW